MNVLDGIRFAIAMRPVIKRLVDSLRAATGGDAQLAEAAVQRMIDRGPDLVAARRDVDARLDAVEQRKREGR